MKRFSFLISTSVATLLSLGLCLGLFISLFLSACTAKQQPLLTPVTSQELKTILAETASKGSQASVVNLWATWCEPCKTEMPELLKFHRSAANSKVRLILISADDLEDEKKAYEFLKTTGIDFETYRLNESPEEFAKNWFPSWSATLPTTFIAGAKGELKTFWVGETNQKSLETKLVAALKPPESPPVLQRHAK